MKTTTSFSNRFQKRSNLFFAFIFLIVFSVCPSASSAEENYVKRQYILIPWGEGKGQLPLMVRPETAPDEPSTYRMGPKLFKVDGNGSIYIYNYDGKKSILKKFSSSGVELASVEVEQPDAFSIQDDVAVIRNNYKNKIIILDADDLSTRKEINVPKDELSFWDDRTAIANGCLYVTSTKNKNRENKKIFFDREKWEKKGKTEFENKPKMKEAIHVLDSEKKKWAGGLENYMTSWGSLFIDAHQNYYFVLESYERYFSAKRDAYILKLGKNRNVLFKSKVRRDVFLGFGSFRGIPVEFDLNGNIYEAWSNEEGLHIDIYENKTSQE